MMRPPVQIGDIKLPDDYEYTELTAAGEVMRHAYAARAQPGMWRGRPLTNLEMHAMVAAKRDSFEAVLERWAARLDEWLDPPMETDDEY
jgi:hypothetical protein